MSLSLRPNLTTIPPDCAFLDAVAADWLQRAGPDPLSVANGLFLVPTRRAARGLAEAFLRQAEGAPLLLPRLVPFGALDETPFALQGALTLNQAVPPAQRLAMLTRMILAMHGKNGAPATADRAWILAVDLAALLDEAALAEIDLAAALPGAAAENFAEHWKVTLEFLAILTDAWPICLEQDGFLDVAARQVALLDAQTKAWTSDPPTIPVIAAGTTGAIPAVARLLRVVAHLPFGQVILPGLDLELDEGSWEALEDTHPQASLRRLLAGLNATRGDVAAWPGANRTAPDGRVAALRRALLPASSLADWQNSTPVATEGMLRLDAADQQEEALSIALVLRDALETPGTNAALVTGDRGLARCVAAELLRFGIIADDSAGEPLAETPPAVFLRLIVAAVAEDLRPVPLLALLKNPFCALGFSPAACRAEARALELASLRGPRPGPGLDGLRARGGSKTLLDRLALCLRPLLDLAASNDVSPDLALTALLEAAESAASTDEAPGAIRLWAGEDGEALATHLAELRDALALLPPQGLQDLPGLLDAALAGAAIRSRRAMRGRDGAEHPRVAIWGLLEARLQSADVLVLGGLTEGSWPPAAESGPWMSRAMRAAIGLPSPEIRIGLAAHDFVMAACAAPKMVLSAPRRRDGAPAVPARWLVRLDALLGDAARLEKHPAPLWARALDRPSGGVRPAKPPAPAPAVALRPRQLSVTEIETWLRDPYAIYAKHVLRLKKLDPLEESADHADYGSIVHDGLHRFFARFRHAWPADALEQLTSDMDAALDQAGMRPALAAWWRPRLRRIAVWVAEAEAERRCHGPLALIATEVKGEWVFPAPAGPFSLRARADRIERRFDASIAILDYKTGTVPAGSEIESGRNAQLPLEAVMACAGAFGPELIGQVLELTYWKITGGHEPGNVVKLYARKGDDLGEAIIRAETSLRELVASFDQADRAYLSQPSPGAAPRFSDYARLARVAEWIALDG